MWKEGRERDSKEIDSDFLRDWGRRKGELFKNKGKTD